MRSFSTGSSSWASILLVLVAILGFWDHATAANITWIGGNVDWADNLDITNWSPNDEPDANDTAIFNTANTVNLATNNVVNGLSLSGGIDLLTNGQDLTVDGTVTASGAGTLFVIENSASLVLADTVVINSGATIEVRDGTLTVDEETGTGFLDINTGGTFTGFGTVNLDDVPGVATSLLINDGTLTAFRAGTIIQPPPADTLTINATSANARVNLDGGAESGVVNIQRNQTLEINGTLADAFSGDLNMFHDTTLDISTAWSMDGGTFDVSNAFIDAPFPSPDTPAGTTTIAGGAFTQSGGAITLAGTGSTIIFDAPFTQSGGNFVNNGLAVFNASTLISNTANMTMPTNTSSITVGAGAVVNVDQPDFNVDGNGTATNVIRINSGGQLDLDLGAGADDTITGTVILSGGELDVTTSDNTWSLGESVSTVVNSGTSQLNGETLSFDGATVTVATGSTLDLNAATTWNTGTNFQIDGVVTADGAVTINSMPANPIDGTGTLRFGSTSTINGINTQIAVATFDWDGTTTGQVHTFAEDAQLFIDAPTFDSDGDMDDSITMATGADLIVNEVAQWEMRGTLTTGGTPAKPVGIGGEARMVLISATGIWNVNGVAFPGDVTFGRGSVTTIAGGAQIISSAINDMIFAGGTITGAGTLFPHAQNSVTDDSSITVATFDFDNGNWVLDAGTTLTVDVDDYDATVLTNKFDGTITSNGGTINMTVADASFVMDGTYNMETLTQSIWSGEPLDIGDDDSATRGKLNINGIGHTTAPIRFNSDADVNVASGATFLITNVANFESVNGVNNASFTGGGTIVFNRQVNFAEATTFNMTGGEIDFDGADLIANLINVDAPVVINAAAITNYGNSNVDGLADTLDINNSPNSGSLTVNLDDPGAAWTLNSEGVMNLVNDNTTSTLLAGSDANLNGTVNVTGDVRVTARVDIGGTVNINTAGEPLRLGGGGGVVDPNRLEGGTILGVGDLGADAGESLHGFGTINTRIAFDGTADLRASGGTLTINGPIVSVGVIGTADSTGVLNVVNAWETDGGPSGSIGGVNLVGGVLQGGQITNDNALGIIGRGTISSPVINNSKIVASFGGTLIIETAGNDNDWDGTTNSGQLNALTGNLEIRDIGSFDFTGTVTASNGHEVFVNGFGLEFKPGSTLNLSSGGVLRSNEGIAIEGNVVVAGSANSRIETDNDSSINFLSGSLTTVNGNLELSTDIAFARTGSSFTGSGSVIVLPGTELSLADTVVVDVLLHNKGEVSIGGAGPGRADLRDYIQTSTGNFDVDLRGVALDQFDRLVIDGAAQLAGTLELGLGGGYVPNIGDTFPIISASAGVIGSFAGVDQPSGMPAGLLFDVIYTPTIVQLTVVNAPIFSADFDLDGDVDGDDLDEWQAGYGVGTLQTEGDADGDGDVDGRDFLIWQRQFGSNPATPVIDLGAVSVPEPASMVPSLVALGLVIAARKKSRR